MIQSGLRGTASRRIACNSSLVIRLAAPGLPLGREAITDAAHGVEVRRFLRIALEALAQAHDEVVDRARRREYLVAPDAVEDLLARDDRAGPLRERFQDHRFLVRQHVR